MLQELTFVDSFLIIAVFDLAAVRGKFSCKNSPEFTARPELGRTCALQLVTTVGVARDEHHRRLRIFSRVRGPFPN